MSVIKLLATCLVAATGANALAETVVSNSVFRMGKEVISIGSEEWEIKKSYSQNGDYAIFHNLLDQRVTLSETGGQSEIAIGAKESVSIACDNIPVATAYELANDDGYVHYIQFGCGDTISVSRGD
jgi:hypothetical protein